MLSIAALTNQARIVCTPCQLRALRSPLRAETEPKMNPIVLPLLLIAGVIAFSWLHKKST